MIKSKSPYQGLRQAKPTHHISGKSRFIKIGLTLFTAATLLSPLHGAEKAKEILKLELKDGSSISGELVKKDQNHYFIYFNREVVKVSQSDITAVKGEQKSVTAEVKAHKLYKTGRNPYKNKQQLFKDIGKAVTLIRTPSGSGTGWFVNQKGYLITNHHVVAGERSITVTMFTTSGKKVFKKVRIVALNASMDLALLKIEDKIELSYPQIYLGSNGDVNKGDKCFTIGNPLGFEHSISEGEISQTARQFQGRLFLQTTAPIAPGNSGGALFNERGEVIGVVNSGAVMYDGLGFAIPVKYVRELLDNVEAYAYDKDNPNNGIQYMESPVYATDHSINFTSHDFIKTGYGTANLQVVDLDGDGVNEVIYVNNNKAEIGIISAKQGKSKRVPKSTDAEDINKLRLNERFAVNSITVSSRISSLKVADLNNDGLKDIIFVGDIDGLAVIKQKKDGTFEGASKIDSVKSIKRQDALEIADIDGNGVMDIFLMDRDNFRIYFDGKERKDFSLNPLYKSRVRTYEIMDINKDGLKDILFFSVDQRFAVHARIQNKKRGFTEEFPYKSKLSGPVQRLINGKEARFITLDTGLNRVRTLELTTEKKAITKDQLSIMTLPSAGANLKTADLMGDNSMELLSIDQTKNEFIIYSKEGDRLISKRSPAPKMVKAFEVYKAASGKSAVFSFSTKDKLFGVSTVTDGMISYPRPINTSGEVQSIKLTKQMVNGKEIQKLFWIEKQKSSYYLKSFTAEALTQLAYNGKEGSLTIEAEKTQFISKSGKSDKLPKKAENFVFADFNGDKNSDLIIYWAFSSNESLYLGKDGTFKEIIKEQNLFEDEKSQKLLAEDIDGDGRKEVLQVQPNFIRVLKVDATNKLYTSQQFNWKFGKINQLSRYMQKDGKSRFAIISGSQAEIIELNIKDKSFKHITKYDLTGLPAGKLTVSDLDGDKKPDLILASSGAIYMMTHKGIDLNAKDEVIFNSDLDTFSYWNLHAGDLDGDRNDEVLLFDSKKAMFEVHKVNKEGKLTLVMRNRLFEQLISQRGNSGSIHLPKDLVIGDVNKDGKNDIICILRDRIAIYMQGPAKK